MFSGKKGVVTAGSDIAALVLLMGLFILLYVLLLPPSERNALLDNNGSSSTDHNNDNFVEGTTLLSAKPGDVQPFKKATITREFSPVLLFTRTETSTVSIASSATVKKSFFGEETKTYSIPLDDIKEITDAKLFFFVNDGRGTFKTTLNGQTIYESSLSSSDVPIVIPVNTLRPSNELTLGVTGLFWESYDLQNINLKVQRNYANTQAKRTFELPSKEYSNLERATLSYFLNCVKLNERGTLTVVLNGYVIATEPVACDAGDLHLDIPEERLRTGTNTLEFTIDQGDYEIQDMELQIRTGDATFPTYNFDVDDDEYFDVFTDCFDSCQDDCFDECRNNNDCLDLCLDDCSYTCDRGEILLQMRFGSGDDRKKGAVTINEQQINFNTDETVYIRDITNSIRRGDNVLQIIPQSEFEITDLQIVFVQ